MYNNYFLLEPTLTQKRKIKMGRLVVEKIDNYDIATWIPATWKACMFGEGFAMFQVP